MARNEEKAMAMLNRWVRAKRELGQKKPVPDREQQINRPSDPSVVSNLTEAEAWRAGVVREIIKKVADIQNGSLAEFKIWELNDSINELVKVKGTWEQRVLELGGRDYRSDAIDKFGDIPMDGSVYQYYGAAKKLQPTESDAASKEQPLDPSASKKLKLSKEYLGLSGYDESLVELEQKLQQKFLSEEHANEVKEHFVEKRRRRIELLQTQDKQVRFSEISAQQFADLLDPSLETMQPVHGQRVFEQGECAPDQEQPSCALPEQLDADDLLRKVAEKKRKLLMQRYVNTD